LVERKEEFREELERKCHWSGPGNKQVLDFHSSEIRVYLIAVRYEKLEKRKLRNTRGLFDKILAASHRTDEMRFIITCPVFVLVKNAIKGHALWSSF